MKNYPGDKELALQVPITTAADDIWWHLSLFYIYTQKKKLVSIYVFS